MKRCGRVLYIYYIYLSMPVELVPLAVVQHVRKGGSGQLLLTI